MTNDSKKKYFSLIFFLLVIWGIMLVKTVLVSAHEAGSFFSPFYGTMFDDTWQSHFNVDLLLFSMVFGGWAFYREKSWGIKILVGIFSILFGGVFSFLYLLICAIRSKGDFHVFLNGETENMNRLYIEKLDLGL